jgi:CheY-like chemotaxis protein
MLDTNNNQYNPALAYERVCWRVGTVLAGGDAMGPDTAGARRLKDIRILVVDGDAPSAKLIRAVLEHEGCEIEAVQTAKEAQALARSFQPHLVLTELVLSDLTGLELIQLFRSDASLGNAVIVAVTASNGPETKRRVLEAGGGGYIRKPIDALSFASQLASHVGRILEPVRITDERGSRTD